MQESEDEMAIDPSKPLMTYAEYLQLPEGFYNLIEGHLIMTPSGSPRHQHLVTKLTAQLYVWNRSSKLGRVYASPFDVKLREEPTPIIVQPDVLFIAKGGRARIAKIGCVGAPDLVVEVVSPGSMRLDGVKKRALYETYGAREYWLVLPALDQVEVLRRGEEGRFEPPVLFERGQILASPVLPGFELDLAELFEPEDGLEEEE